VSKEVYLDLQGEAVGAMGWDSSRILLEAGPINAAERRLL
jgi:hypothetical protein